MNIVVLYFRLHTNRNNTDIYDDTQRFLDCPKCPFSAFLNSTLDPWHIELRRGFTRFVGKTNFMLVPNLPAATVTSDDEVIDVRIGRPFRHYELPHKWIPHLPLCLPYAHPSHIDRRLRGQQSHSREKRNPSHSPSNGLQLQCVCVCHSICTWTGVNGSR